MRSVKIYYPQQNMFCRILSSAVKGIEGEPVHIELDIGRGMPCFVMVGSLSNQVRESQDRVRTALRNLDIVIPPKRITVNIAPADIKKEGTRFDLPIAAALLTALEIITPDSLRECMLIGELRLNGETQGVPGVLPSVIMAKKTGIKTCIVPFQNAGEAAVVNGIEIAAVRNLGELIEFCNGSEEIKKSYIYKRSVVKKPERALPDFSDIKGQTVVKRAVVIAAAGFHNILMSGPPGSGKSMAAKRIPSIMPAMTADEQLEVSRIYSVAGILSSEQPLITQRPFRAPHYSLSPQALCGGGRIPRPGEITLAHRQCHLVKQFFL